MYEEAERVRLFDPFADVDPQEQVIILVILQAYAIPQQQQLVRQATIAEIDLRTALELVFGRAQHHEIIELVLWPFAVEVALPFLHLLFVIAGLLLLLLLDPVHIHLALDV